MVTALRTPARPNLSSTSHMCTQELSIMKNLVSRFVKDESGATAIEYGLIAAGIAIAIITAVQGGGTKGPGHPGPLSFAKAPGSLRPVAGGASGRFPIVHFSWIGSPDAWISRWQHGL